MPNLDKVIYPELSYALGGIFFKVHNELGRSCKENQYCDAIEKLLKERKLNYKRELCIKSNKELIRDNSDRIDFIVEDKIVIEVKAKRIIGREEYNQIKRYLSSLDLKLGLLVNFHQNYLTPKRILNAKVKE